MLLSLTTWSDVRNLREELSRVADLSDDERASLVTVVSELSENAAKYGAIAGASRPATVDVAFSSTAITVVVGSMIHEQAGHRTRAKKMIDDINAGDAAELEAKRVLEIALNAGDVETNGSRLGLLRLSSECRFKLSYGETSDWFFIRAERSRAGDADQH